MQSGKKRKGRRERTALSARLAEILDVPAEGLSREGVIEIVGGETAVISGCECVLDYGAESVLLKVREGCIRIEGERLEMQSLMNDRITVSGRICAVYLRTEGMADDAGNT